MSYVEQHMIDAVRNHSLTEVTPSGSVVRAFSLQEGSRRTMSVLLLFTPEGIVLMGDLRLTRQGVVAAYHQNLSWFCGRMHEDYLCSKFLVKEWQPEVAATDLLRHLAEAYDLAPDQREALLRVVDDIGVMTQPEFLAAVEGLLDPEVAAGFGTDYNIADAGWLVIIQRTFAALYPSLA